MKRSISLFVVWILLATFAAQAIAAASHFCCDQIQEHGIHSEIGVHHHYGLAEHDEANSAKLYGSDSNSAQHHHQSHHGKHAVCSQCVACCGEIAGPPSTAIPMAIDADISAVLIEPAPLNTSFIPTGPERPPRHYSA